VKVKLDHLWRLLGHVTHCPTWLGSVSKKKFFVRLRADTVVVCPLYSSLERRLTNAAIGQTTASPDGIIEMSTGQ
jgi:hypothetical protein